MQTKLCIFDLDGTLINSLYDLADAMNYALAKNAFATHEREAYRYMVGSGISVLADRAMVVPEGTSSIVKDMILQDFNQYYHRHFIDNTRPYPGIPELLTKLTEKNIRCAVLSNKPDQFAGKIVKLLFPEQSFAAVWGKREEYPRKPEPDSVFAMMNSLQVRPEECLYIGDSNIDMLTAKNAGLVSVGVSWGFRPVEELQSAGAVHIIRQPDELLSLL